MSGITVPPVNRSPALSSYLQRTRERLEEVSTLPVIPRRQANPILDFLQSLMPSFITLPGPMQTPRSPLDSFRNKEELLQLRRTIEAENLAPDKLKQALDRIHEIIDGNFRISKDFLWSPGQGPDGPSSASGGT